MPVTQQTYFPNHTCRHPSDSKSSLEASPAGFQLRKFSGEFGKPDICVSRVKTRYIFEKFHDKQEMFAGISVDFLILSPTN